MRRSNINFVASSIYYLRAQLSAESINLGIRPSESVCFDFERNLIRDALTNGLYATYDCCWE